MALENRIPRAPFEGVRRFIHDITGSQRRGVDAPKKKDQHPQDSIDLPSTSPQEVLLSLQEKGIFSADEHDQREQVRNDVVRVRKIDVNDREEIGTYFRFLTHETNRVHFAKPPERRRELQRLCSHKGMHALVAENALGEIVGGMMIRDAEWPQHDHFIEKVVIDPDKQGKGIGTQMMILGIDWGFENITHDGRKRLKLDLSIIEGVEGWERMRDIVEKLGFEFRSRLPLQVDVVVKEEGGIEEIRVPMPTIRWEVVQDMWQMRRPRLEKYLKRNLPQQT